MIRVNHYYKDGTLYLGQKSEIDGKVTSEAGVGLYTFAKLDRYPKIIAKTYWPHSILPHPAARNPVKASEPWEYTAATWHLSKGQING